MAKRAAMLAAAVLLLSGAPASAATVWVQGGGGEDGEPVELTLKYEAAPGEENLLDVHRAFDGWLVRDAGRVGTWPSSTPVTLTPGAGCTGLDERTAFCALTVGDGFLYYEEVRIALGNMNDGANASAACPAVEVIETDYYCAGAWVDGGSGDDALYGTHVVTLEGRPVPSVRSLLIGGTGRDSLFAGAAGSILDGGSDADRLYGASASDDLVGGGGADWIAGRAGNDAAWGGDGGDTIRGGSGRDKIRGSAGSDTLFARDGERDYVRGGPGTDRAEVDPARDVTTSIERFFSR